MVVAAVAWRQLSPATKARVDVLLRLNEDYSSWVDKANGADPRAAAFTLAACWADDIKSATDYHDPQAQHPDTHAADNTGYADHWRHRPWHYKDIPFSPDGTPLAAQDPVNAEERIELFRGVIADSAATDQLKSYDLVWLLHLVGDVHQPLHATSRYTHDTPHGDRGGGQVCLGAAGPQCKNLHGAWDEALGLSRQPKSALRAADPANPHKLPTPAAGDIAETDVGAWLDESFALAKQDAYATPVEAGDGPYTLTTAYRVHMGGLADSQVALAGARLARLLEDNLK
jgi:hypothetical protein